MESQSENLRITAPESINAIRVMTIHQAKGLEFPVVILPFMDTPLRPNVKEKIETPNAINNLRVTPLFAWKTQRHLLKK